MQVSGATPGLCGSIAAGMKWSGKRRLTREQSSLQIAAQVDDTWKSPMWWAMKLARGLKMVRSDPRAFICLQLVALDRLADLVVGDLQIRDPGRRRRIRDAGDLLVAPRLQRLGRGRVVAVDVDDHGAPSVAEVERQADVVLGDGARGVLRVEQVVELGVLQLGADRTAVGKAVHERGEPPREPLGPPDAAQAALPSRRRGRRRCRRGSAR